MGKKLHSYVFCCLLIPDFILKLSAITYHLIFLLSNFLLFLQFFHFQTKFGENSSFQRTSFSTKFWHLRRVPNSWIFRNMLQTLMVFWKIFNDSLFFKTLFFSNSSFSLFKLEIKYVKLTHFWVEELREISSYQKFPRGGIQYNSHRRKR